MRYWGVRGYSCCIVHALCTLLDQHYLLCGFFGLLFRLISKASMSSRQNVGCFHSVMYNMHCTICTVVLHATQACDHRSQTALLAAFRNGHVELVDWLLGHVAHLPSEQDCQKALLAPSPPATDLTPRRARCLEMISKVCKDIFYCRPVFCPFYICMYIS